MEITTAIFIRNTSKCIHLILSIDKNHSFCKKEKCGCCFGIGQWEWAGKFLRSTIEKLDFLEHIISRYMDINDSAREDWEGHNEPNRKKNMHGEYLNCLKQTVGRNVDIESVVDEGSDGNVIGNGGRGAKQNAEQNCALK